MLKLENATFALHPNRSRVRTAILLQESCNTLGPILTD